MTPPLQVEYGELKNLAQTFASASNWFRDVGTYSEATRRLDWPISATFSATAKAYDHACDTMTKTGEAGLENCRDIVAGLDEVHRRYTHAEAVSLGNVYQRYPWMRTDSWRKALQDETDIASHDKPCNSSSCTIGTSTRLKSPAWATPLAFGEFFGGPGALVAAIWGVRARSVTTAGHAMIVLATDLILFNVCSAAPFDGAARIWAELGEGADSVKTDLQAHMRTFDSSWDGAAAEAFRKYTEHTLFPVMDQLGPFATSIGELLKQTARVVDDFRNSSLMAVAAATAAFAGILFCPEPWRSVASVTAALALFSWVLHSYLDLHGRLSRVAQITKTVNDRQQEVLNKAFGAFGKNLLVLDIDLLPTANKKRWPDSLVRRDWHPAAAT